MNRQPLISDYADDADMAEILREFVVGMRETSQKLTAHLQAGDLEEVKRIGHQMKGAGASYGFQAITDAGAELESAVEAGRDIESRVANLQELFARAMLGMGLSAEA
jgi:HPt (histidine-containing phosphotransfer) domain-containing protein